MGYQSIVERAEEAAKWIYIYLYKKVAYSVHRSLKHRHTPVKSAELRLLTQ